jgi:hypothetical protein
MKRTAAPESIWLHCSLCDGVLDEIRFLADGRPVLDGGPCAVQITCDSVLYRCPAPCLLSQVVLIYQVHHSALLARDEGSNVLTFSPYRWSRQP